MNLLEGLNAPQREAVQHREGPLLILAGAGSGKTRVITFRVAYLMKEYNIPPYHILAVTFTNKAASEMKERLTRLLGEESPHLWISTFHFLGARILRQEADRLGYHRNFTILDPKDQEQIIKDIQKDLEMNPKNFPPASILSGINGAKNQLLDPLSYQSRARGFMKRKIGEVYEKYQEALKDQNLMDFGDLLLKTVELFVEHPDVLNKYVHRFQYILVDEYQDVNWAQYRLIRLLTKERQNLCVVGDPDQGIYSFRGASIENILNFEEDYPRARVVKLEENYRSSPSILKAAQGVISRNSHRKEKDLWTRKKDEASVSIYHAPDYRSEAQFVGEEILALKRRGLSLSHMAVFYRTNYQSRIFEDVFRRLGIPHMILGATRFYDRMEIKDLLAYLRLIYNPLDDQSLLRILNVPRRGLGEKTRDRIQVFAEERGLSLFQALGYGSELGLSSSRWKKVLEFYEILQELMEKKESISVDELTKEILTKTDYMVYIENFSEKENKRQENIEEFLHLIQERGQDTTLEDFLQDMALVSDVDSYEKEKEAVVLMTLHTAKGLEFPVAFLTGLEEGCLPHSRSLEKEQGIEEERRLCYVGMTRAMERLYLTRSNERLFFGERRPQIPSRFLREIPSDVLKPYTAEKKEQKTLEPIESERGEAMTKYAPGDRVHHEYFGLGEVIGWKQGEEEKVLQVFFPTHGERDLILSMAPLEKLEE